MTKAFIIWVHTKGPGDEFGDLAPRPWDKEADTPMTTTSIPKAEEQVRCFRHEGEGCPRCDGSGFRPRPVCAGCGQSARTLSPARTAKSPEEARALPRYCPRCNPRRRGINAALAALEGMGA